MLKRFSLLEKAIAAVCVIVLGFVVGAVLASCSPASTPAPTVDPLSLVITALPAATDSDARLTGTFRFTVEAQSLEWDPLTCVGDLCLWDLGTTEQGVSIPFELTIVNSGVVPVTYNFVSSAPMPPDSGVSVVLDGDLYTLDIAPGATHNLPGYVAVGKGVPEDTYIIVIEIK